MVKGRVLDLRWTECVSATGFVDPAATGPVGVGGTGGASAAGTGGVSGHSRDSTLVDQHAAAGATSDPPPLIDAAHEDVMMPVLETEMGHLRGATHAHSVATGVYYDDMMEVVGPKLFPITPIMRFAMRDVVHEYEDNQSVSEYASLSDVDEY